jgi:hypothetical protein
MVSANKRYLPSLWAKDRLKEGREAQLAAMVNVLRI